MYFSNVDDKTISFELDTGASLNAISCDLKPLGLLLN